VREARRAGWVVEVYLHSELPAALAAEFGPHTWPAGVPCRTAEPAALAGLSGTRSPVGLVAVCRTATADPVALFPSRPSRGPAQAGTRGESAPGADWAVDLALVAVSDPGNAGTVVRAAHAAGARAVHFVGNGVDPFNDKCVRSAAGSLCHVALTVTDDAATIIGLAQAAGWRVLAAAATGVDVRLLGGMLATEPHLWLLGDEARGLPSGIRALADMEVSLPMPGGTESLNVAMAGTLLVYQSLFARNERPTMGTDSTGDRLPPAGAGLGD